MNNYQNNPQPPPSSKHRNALTPNDLNKFTIVIEKERKRISLVEGKDKIKI